MELWRGVKKFQNLTFKVNFLCQKSSESFSIFFSLENTNLGAHNLLLTFFDNFLNHFITKAQNICKIFSLITSRKPLTRETDTIKSWAILTKFTSWMTSHLSLGNFEKKNREPVYYSYLTVFTALDYYPKKSTLYNIFVHE